MNNLTIKKHIILITLAVISAIFIVFGIGSFSYSAKAATSESSSVPKASDYDFKAISGARIVLQSLDDYDIYSTIIGFSVSISNAKYNSDEMEIKACLVDTSKKISIDNMVFGIYSSDSTQNVNGDNLVRTFRFSIPKSNYNTKYRCIFVLYVPGDGGDYQTVLADYSGVDTDRSVYSVAKAVLSDPNSDISESYKEKLQEIVDEGVKIEEANKRQEQIDSTIKDFKDYGQALVSDNDFRKVISVIGGVFLVVLFFSFLSVLMGLRK